MYCTQCGSKIPDGQNVCPNCSAVSGGETPAAETQVLSEDYNPLAQDYFANQQNMNANQPPFSQAASPQAQSYQQSNPVQPPVYGTNQANGSAPQYTGGQYYQQPQMNNTMPPQGQQNIKILKPNNGNVGFSDAIKLFFQNFVNFEGRASKSEYWYAYLFCVLIALIPGIGQLVMIAAQIGMLSAGIRRLHDVGRAWTYILMGLIPIAGPIILIIEFCKDSDGDNQWGPGRNDNFAFAYQPQSQNYTQVPPQNYTQPPQYHN